MGRLRCSFVTIILGLATFIVLIVLESHWKNQWLMATLAIARAVFMNCSGPIISAIMTDHIDEASRGKWESLNSITTAGWCGSAMLGGYICDHYGYGTTFYVTAILQVVATLALIPVLFKEK